MIKGGIITKWYSGNGIYIELANGNRLYVTKRELVDIMLGAQQFIEAYPEDFYGNVIDLIDDEGDPLYG